MRQGSTEGHAPRLAQLWASQTTEGRGTEELFLHLFDLELTFPNLFKDRRETGLISREISVHRSVNGIMWTGPRVVNILGILSQKG